MVYGIGVNNIGKYPTSIDGVHTKEYLVWKSMLQRCVPGGTFQTANPSYIGCSVHPDFIHFQDFAEWCSNQIGFGNDGFALDKDILVPGNKVYGPDTCCFVPKSINVALTHKQLNNSRYGIGVKPSGGKFISRIKRRGVWTHLGTFDTISEACEQYKAAKTDEVHRLAVEFREMIDRRVYDAMMEYRMD